MKKLFGFSALALAATTSLQAQYSVNALETYTLETFTGNTGGGLVPAPGAGQLSSQNWIVNGIGGVAATFGGTYDAGVDPSYARGAEGLPSSNKTGLFNYTDVSINGGTGSFGWHAGGNDLKGGSDGAVVRILNNTGVAVGFIRISYELWVQNDAAQSTGLDLRSTATGALADIQLATPVPGSAYTSPVASGGGSPANAPYVKTEYSFIIPVSIAPGATHTLAWAITPATGQGAEDHFAIDNVNFALAVPETSTVGAASVALLAIGAGFLRRRSTSKA